MTPPLSIFCVDLHACGYLIHDDLTPLIGGRYAAVVLQRHMQRLALVWRLPACIALMLISLKSAECMSSGAVFHLKGAAFVMRRNLNAEAAVHVIFMPIHTHGSEATDSGQFENIQHSFQPASNPS